MLFIIHYWCMCSGKKWIESQVLGEVHETYSSADVKVTVFGYANKTWALKVEDVARLLHLAATLQFMGYAPASATFLRFIFSNR